MTKLLDEAVGLSRNLSPDMQDHIARMMLLFVGEESPLGELTPEDEAAVHRSREAAARGQFATDEDVGAVWVKHGL